MKDNDTERQAIILPYIKDRKVLNLGAGYIPDRNIHSFICDHARRCVGLEIDTIRAEKLRGMGYEVLVGDAQGFDISMDFQTIMAGDLIEHLTNHKGFFESCAKHLVSGGHLIISTHNVYAINRMLRALVGKSHDYCEHTCSFDLQLLRQISSRFPAFSIAQGGYYNYSVPNLKNKAIKLMTKLNKEYSEAIYIILRRR